MKLYSALSILVLAAVAVQTRAEDVIVIEEDVVDCLYQKPDCVCPEFEEPVCSINGCTYGNDCKRLCAEAEFAYDGACHEDDDLIAEDLVKEDLVQDDVALEELAKEELAKEELAKEELAKEELAKIEPVKEDEAQEHLAAVERK